MAMCSLARHARGLHRLFGEYTADAAFMSMGALAEQKGETEASATIGSEGGTLRLMEGAPHRVPSW